MYYKIINKDSEVYKKLYELRQKELQFEKDNLKLIEEKTGLKWGNYMGDAGQQTFSRLPEYIGFEFLEPEKVNSKIWKRHEKHNDIFIPNCRTKLGREISEFLSNGLNKSRYSIVFDILNVSHNGIFTFPFAEVVSDVIIIYLDKHQIPSNDDVIEITSVEFESIRNNKQ